MIFLGPKAQGIIRPYLLRADDSTGSHLKRVSGSNDQKNRKVVAHKRHPLERTANGKDTNRENATLLAHIDVQFGDVARE